MLRGRALVQQIVDPCQLVGGGWVSGGQRRGTVGDGVREPDEDLGVGELVEQLAFGEGDRALVSRPA